MEKGTSRRYGFGIISVVISVFFLLTGSAQAETVFHAGSNLEPNETKADLITIETLKFFGDIERPEVQFPHDRHTDALEKEGKDCKTCHLSDKNYEVLPKSLKIALSGIEPLSLKFKRFSQKDNGLKEIRDIYHTECIGCHTRMQAEGDKTGPVVCGECHRKDAEKAIRVPIGLNKSLHFRHLRAQQDKCETCHHEYDELNKKIIYTKGKESSCRYCHKEKTEKETLSMRESSHLACISCHRKNMAPDKKTGPSKCSGCHDPIKQAAIETVKDVPRMDRKQPNVSLITTGRIGAKMKAVPFDHLAHEGYNDTCRACHHADLAKCNTCHAPGGSKGGKGVSLERAMHQMRSESSCLGCHNQKQETKNCAGCHVFRVKEMFLPKDPASCERCHLMAIPEQEPEALRETLVTEAGKLLRARPSLMGTYDTKDIPENIEIKELADRYEPVKFPHRKIIESIVKSVGENQLAKFFHTDKGTLCQGCHHHSPVSNKPPLCVNCHGKPFDDENLFRPGRMAAFHLQCMNCHKEMGIEKPAKCEDCHKPRDSKNIVNR